MGSLRGPGRLSEGAGLHGGPHPEALPRPPRAPVGDSPLSQEGRGLREVPAVTGLRGAGPAPPSRSLTLGLEGTGLPRSSRIRRAFRWLVGPGGPAGRRSELMGFQLTRGILAVSPDPSVFAPIRKGGWQGGVIFSVLSALAGPSLPRLRWLTAERRSLWASCGARAFAPPPVVAAARGLPGQGLLLCWSPGPLRSIPESRL